MIATAHAHGVPCLIDAAQSIPHMKVDVQELDADFLVFSAHKIYGPTGVGVLYGKEEWLDRLPPYQGGGEMIQHVSFEKTTFNELPFKFEAGTPDYIGTTGLAKALDYVNGHGIEQIAAHEHELTTYALQRLKEIPHIRIFGEAAERGAVISFLVGDIHHFDLGTLPGSSRYCRENRASLCTTSHATSWHRRNCTCFVCHVQYQIGNRHFGGRN